MEENGVLSETELQTLTAQYPKSGSASFEDENGVMVTIYLKKMERSVYVGADNLLSKKDSLTAGEFLIKNLWIGGYAKEKIIADLETLKNATQTMLPLLFAKSGELKKN